MSSEAEIVSEADLEQQLERVRAAAAGSREGIFGPDSLTWRIDRDAAIFLGAGRALLLQLAHPWVATAIVEHSGVLGDPIGRFHRTFAVVLTMIFGTVDDALAAARQLHRRHSQITGTLRSEAGTFPAGSAYAANDVAALCWVYTTLTETALIARDLVLPPLSAKERQSYYTEKKRFAALFGIPEERLPPDWASFAAYNEAMCQSDILTVGAEAKAIARAVMAGAGSWLPVPFWYRAVTAQMLPARLRDAFGLPYGDAEQRAAGRALARLRRLYPLLPQRLRYVGPYQEAQARLAGRPIGFPTRLMNRFWIGRSFMASGFDHGTGGV